MAVLVSTTVDYIPISISGVIIQNKTSPPSQKVGANILCPHKCSPSAAKTFTSLTLLIEHSSTVLAGARTCVPIRCTCRLCRYCGDWQYRRKLLSRR
ncbi:hypothetical protein J6590_021518 [Homalodisca vitripennis]|nr:hypothetical protein J6590_021518 [Homalodisca vitripennis]